MKIITNNHYRDILAWDELTDKQRDEHSHSYDSVESSSFFIYKGHAYDLASFTSFNGRWGLQVDAGHAFYGWDASHGDSYFSGILIKLSDCGTMLKVATYLS